MSMRLSYIGIEAGDPAAWQDFGELFGFQVEGQGDALIFRIDERARRVIVTEGPLDDMSFCGWETDTADEFEACLGRLVGNSVAVTEGTADDAALRGVARVARFADPDGLPMELSHGAREAETPFHSDLIEHGFVTGDQGFGHIAAPADDYRKSETFLCDALGARLTDRIRMPRPGGVLEATFLHTNARHHSVAYVQAMGPRTKRIHHFMVECRDIADLGRTYDRVKAAGLALGLDLGQHSNDRNVTFYTRTPSGFFMELGFGGVSVTDDGWVACSYDTASLWGHERLNELR